MGPGEYRLLISHRRTAKSGRKKWDFGHLCLMSYRSAVPNSPRIPPQSAEEYDTVLLAVGRDPDTGRLGLDKLGVTTDPRSGKVVAEDNRTSVGNIYAIGDIVEVGRKGLGMGLWGLFGWCWWLEEIEAWICLVLFKDDGRK